MHRFRNSLAAQIFVAIAATAALIIAIMAILVALSMRDGFAQYLLRGELTRFDALEQALIEAHVDDARGWPELADNPDGWNKFVGTHFQPRGREEGRGSRPSNPPPPDRRGGPPPRGPGGGDRLSIRGRLMLLDSEGVYVVGAKERAGLFEKRAICVNGNCENGKLLGYIGLNAPLLSASGGDTFFLRRQYNSLALSALLAVLLSAIAAFFVARQILVPIRQLGAGAKTMASGDYSARITQDRSDELGQLIVYYNALAATLERTDKAEREWISNTSHELQTPLATLRAQIEAVQDGVRQPDAETLAGMHAAMMRLSRLIQDIKILSHSREGGLTTALHLEDLCGIAREAASVAKPLLEKKQINLELDLPEKALLMCDRIRIFQVIDNLLQNAARYTNAPGQVRLSVQDTADMVHLIVEDTPPAPPEADMPKLFDRFYRAESSRSRAFGGSGLGLSVCRAIVEAHGGTVAAERSAMGGLRVTIALPKEKT
jgi:two-component system sensor histidine kinase BaeS